MEAPVNLCEARRVYSGGSRRTQDPSGASSSTRSRRRARRGREAPAQSSLPGARSANSARAAPGPPLSPPLRPVGLPKALTPLRGVPPIHGGLTSDPARCKVFQLEAAHGRGHGATPARSRVSAHSVCAGHGPREGRAGRAAESRSAPRSDAKPGLQSPVPHGRRRSPLPRPAGS